jgi:organic radical activating enzyme
MLPNTQPIEKPDIREDGSVEVHSVFYTLQGEGPYTGRRSVFVRLSGCNLQCPGCDTEYTQNRTRMSPADIAYLIDEIQATPANACKVPALVVITGGEPFRQNIAPLCRQLQLSRTHIQIETNGVLGLPSGMKSCISNGARVVVSPKTSRIHDDWRVYAAAFKYVLQEGAVDESDLLPLQALGHKATPRVARPPEGYRGPIFVTPMDEKDEAKNDLNLQLVARAALRHGYIAGVQLHKLLNLE